MSSRKLMSSDEAIVDINLLLANYAATNKTPKIAVTGFLGGYKKDKSICLVECEEHGSGCKFGSPWNPRLNHLRRSKDVDTKNISGCPKCFQNYRYSREENINRIKEKLEGSSCVFVGFEGEKINNGTPCLLRCDIHGDLWCFDKPVKPTVQKILFRNITCPKCSCAYRYSEGEVTSAIQAVLENTNPRLTFVGFNGPFRGKETRVQLCCEKHGFLSQWGNPSLPSAEDILKVDGTRCSKCSNRYAPTEEECRAEISGVLKNTCLSLKEFKEPYSGRNTKIELFCSIHPDEIYLTDIDRVINQKPRCCPTCAKNAHHLKACISNKNVWALPRQVYYVEILCSSSNKTIGYKIGLSFTGIKNRFPQKTCQTRGIKIGLNAMITLPSVIACFFEVFILSLFFKDVSYLPQLINWGATECFGRDVLGGATHERLMQYLYHSYQSCPIIIQNAALSDDEEEQLHHFFREHANLFEPNQLSRSDGYELEQMNVKSVLKLKSQASL